MKKLRAGEKSATQYCGRDNQWVEKGTKTTSSTRTVRAPDYIMARLRAAKEEASDDHVTHLKGSCLRDRLHTITKHNGLPSIRFHDLRHTFSTHALSSGVDAKTLSGILGHSRASFTLDTYTHVTGDMHRRAAEIVGGFMNDIMVRR